MSLAEEDPGLVQPAWLWNAVTNVVALFHSAKPVGVKSSRDSNATAGAIVGIAFLVSVAGVLIYWSVSQAFCSFFNYC